MTSGTATDRVTDVLALATRSVCVGTSVVGQWVDVRVSENVCERPPVLVSQNV